MDKFFETELGYIIKGNCLIVIEELARRQIKFDAIITDPPQGITQNDWDKPLPLDKMWSLLYKIKRDERTPIILFSNQPFTTDLITSNRKDFKYCKYWEKDRPSGFLNANRQPLRDIEEIPVFYSKQCTYNPQFWEGKPLHSIGRNYKNKKGTNNNYGNYNCQSDTRDARCGSTSKYPRQLMSYKRPHPPEVPTEKPIGLLEDLVLTYTNEGDSVLDFTAGSITLGRAAENLNRRWVCIEQEEKYCVIGRDRFLKRNKGGKNIERSL